MKKNIFLPIVAVFGCSLTSCNTMNIIDAPNIVWKSDFFNIIATSEQLIKQSNHSFDNDDYYSSITIWGKIYSCTIYLKNNGFNLTLYDKETHSLILLYSIHEHFLDGHCDTTLPYPLDDQDYKYCFNVRLSSDNQYYEYCKDNDKFYPLSFYFYGYEAN